MSTKILGPEMGYIDILNHATNDHIKNQRECGKDTEKTPIRPSSSGKCTRELAYELMEHKGFARYEKESHTAEIQRVFGLGHSVEYHVIREIDTMLKEYFTTRYKQQVLSFKYLTSEIDPSLNQWLEGSLDLVLWSDKYKCIVDVKSKKAKYSSYRASDWEEYSEKLNNLPSVTTISDSSFYVEDLELFIKDIKDPFLAMNFYQLNLYACNPFIIERGIDHAAIIQYNKNTSELREIRFKPSLKLYNEIIHKFQNVIEVVATKEPERASKDHSLGSMKCAFCSFNKMCWSDADPLKAWFKTMPPKDWPKDTSRLSAESSAKLEELYNQFKNAMVEKTKLESIEEEIVIIMTRLGIKKIRFDDGAIYELKYLKSPREHVELRRSKI